MSRIRPRREGDRVVVVGGGHAAISLLGFLRQGGHQGDLVLVGDEPQVPYQRPPLSKDFVGDAFEHAIRPAGFFQDQEVELRLGTRVCSVDVGARHVTLASGEQLPYDVLVLATGARPNQLPVSGTDLDGVGTLRTLDDARRLRTWIREGRRLVIVGGGYVGLEVAAAVATFGAGVTVLEREERLLARSASNEMARFLYDAHVASGTTIRTATSVTAIEGVRGQVRGVVADDGTSIACDAVLVGVGATPNDELARAVGIHCDAGIVVDENARTDTAGVLAIGDVTQRPVPGVGRRRLESIPSATEQARQAAATILGVPPPPPEVPWFWSDQSQLKIKIAGIVATDAEVVVRRHADSTRLALLHHRRGRPVAVETVNAAPEFTAARKWIAGSNPVDPDRFADSALPLRDVV